jgi:hypothetical protein
MKYQSLIVLTAVMLMLMLVGCADIEAVPLNQEAVVMEKKSSETPVGLKIGAGSTSDQKRADDSHNDSITPYQFLNLMLGNAEQISCHYKVLNCESQEEETASFYKSGEKWATLFTARDMNGRKVTVREMEMDGRVHYIMEETCQVKSYHAPAQDFIIDDMMKAAAAETTRKYEAEGYQIYEHRLPFSQDETITLLYRFYMQNGILKKLEYFIGDTQAYQYEFTDFIQEVRDQSLFEYPRDWHEEWFDYPYSGEHMPPWWEPGKYNEEEI